MAAQELIFPKMVNSWTAATEPGHVFGTAAWQNSLLVDCTMEVRGGSRREAFAFLHKPLRFSAKQPKVQALKYLRRGLDNFFGAIRDTSVRVFTKTMFERHKVGTKKETMENNGKKHSKVVFAPEWATSMAAGNAFLWEASTWDAIIEATIAVVRRFGASSNFLRSSAVPGGRPVLFCLLGHVALVALKVHEFLKRAGDVVDTSQPGANPGHREPWRALLADLSRGLTQRGETRNGLRLVDGESAGRGTAPADSAGEGDLALFGTWAAELPAEAPGDAEAGEAAAAGVAEAAVTGAA